VTGDRTRLGQLVSDRRKALGLSVVRAASEAGINRGTWTSVERGDRDTEAFVYGPIERVLRWRRGSFEAALRGGNPIPEDQDLPAGGTDLEQELRAIADNPRRSAHLRDWARSQLMQLAAIRAAARAEAEASGEQAG
jgi:hypothetical protein